MPLTTRAKERIGDSMKFLIVRKLIPIDIVNVHYALMGHLYAWESSKHFCTKKDFNKVQ
jgi:hypothetical protein